MADAIKTSLESAVTSLSNKLANMPATSTGKDFRETVLALKKGIQKLDKYTLRKTRTNNVLGETPYIYFEHGGYRPTIFGGSTEFGTAETSDNTTHVVGGITYNHHNFPDRLLREYCMSTDTTNTPVTNSINRAGRYPLQMVPNLREVNVFRDQWKVYPASWTSSYGNKRAMLLAVRNNTNEDITRDLTFHISGVNNSYAYAQTWIMTPGKTNTEIGDMHDDEYEVLRLNAWGASTAWYNPTNTITIPADKTVIVLVVATTNVFSATNEYGAINVVGISGVGELLDTEGKITIDKKVTRNVASRACSKIADFWRVTDNSDGVIY